MTEDDRRHWDKRHSRSMEEGAVAPAPPALFADHVDHFPSHGTALDVACGLGAGSLWLARRGLSVVGVDVSSVAVTSARTAAESSGLAVRCRFRAERGELRRAFDELDVLCDREQDGYAVLIGRRGRR